MINLKQLYREIQASRSPENLGDFAILKADALGARMHSSVATKMESVVGYYPAIDMEALGQFPEGSFGREYARHMQENRLTPFNVSPELDDVAQRNVFALRYAVTHDIFHVLLGFDTSYAGEIGVLAFAAAQNYSPALKLSLKAARVLYPLLAPRQRQAIAANLKLGAALGQQAKFLLGYRFEDHWSHPLTDIKAELGLPCEVSPGKGQALRA
ncbi:MAG: Coq4 family protein [Leptolyngbyaceae cyanobacterium MO_188.B28]|nr:Coq4 family protein [Leptolyngbyaceae cyanobacterium MO_188.B28]